MFPFFFVAFVLFLIVFNFYQRKGTHRQQELVEQFWERERHANSTRKQDISNLEYIKIPAGLIPGGLHTEAEEKLLALIDRPMIDLTEFSNTDLKLKYGVANLNTLGDAETDYITALQQLPVYAKELMDAGKPDAAKELMDFAQENNMESSAISALQAELS